MIEVRGEVKATGWFTGFAIFVLCTAHPQVQEPRMAFRFDCGTPTSPLKFGWTKVTHETVYLPQRGYGWLRPAASSFDRDKIFVPDWLKPSVPKIPPPDEMLRDGVFDKGELTFRVDVPNGSYWLIVSIGDEQENRRNMSIFANGVAIAQNVTTMTSWGGYATNRTFRKLIHVTDEKLLITFTHKGDGNSVLGIEVVPFIPFPIRFTNGKWQMETVKGLLAPKGKDEALLKQGLDAINERDWQRARKMFDSITHPLFRATALTIWADMLDVPEEEAHKALERAKNLAEETLRKFSHASPEGIFAHELLRIIGNYLRARQFITMLNYGWATRQTGFTFSRRLQMARDWLEQITEDDPLFDRACLNLGRIHFWIWREDASASEKALADRWFGILKQRQPFAKLVRLYTGEQVAWGETFIAAAKGLPDWVAKLHEAMGRLLTVLRWWIENRQQENGEMGGGYGDDVEMLRQWHVFIAGADDETVRRGWLKLAHGVWHSGVIDPEHGYAREASDVQHSAELMADSHPAMIGLDYGNPVWIERCMATARTMRDFWTAVNAKGHRHFKSAFIGATSMNTNPPWNVDVPMNARATRPVLWLAWYNRNPVAVKLLQEWMDAWVEDAMREEDGKPSGVLPAAVSFESDRFAEHGTWFDPKLYWDYFRWDAFYHLHELYDHLLAVYEFTGNEKYLKPIEAAMELAMEWKRNPVDNPLQGSRLWAARLLYFNMAPTVEKYRLMTGRKNFDDYLRERGSPYMRFLLTGDKRILAQECERVAASIRNNFELLTSEVLFTDRVAVTQQPMWAMMTGGVGLPYFYPCYAVTWRNTGMKFAAIVAHSEPNSVKVLAVNLEPKPRMVKMQLWRLTAGIYEVRVGIDGNDDDVMDAITHRERFALTERGQEVAIPLAHGKTHIVEVIKQSELPNPVPEFYDRPDLAIGDQDVRIGEGEGRKQWIQAWQVVKVPLGSEVPITVTVHNIGHRFAPAAKVSLVENQSGKRRLVSKVIIPSLPPPDDLSPSCHKIVFKWCPSRVGECLLEVTVELVNGEHEITTRNNVVQRKVRVVRERRDEGRQEDAQSRWH